MWILNNMVMQQILRDKGNEIRNIKELNVFFVHWISLTITYSKVNRNILYLWILIWTWILLSFMQIKTIHSKWTWRKSIFIHNFITFILSASIDRKRSVDVNSVLVVSEPGNVVVWRFCANKLLNVAFLSFPKKITQDI